MHWDLLKSEKRIPGFPTTVAGSRSGLVSTRQPRNDRSSAAFQRPEVNRWPAGARATRARSTCLPTPRGVWTCSPRAESGELRFRAGRVAMTPHAKLTPS